MSYAVAKPQASSPAGNDGLPSTATVYDFICLFTHDLRRKQKRWQDGKLKYHSFNKKVMVYDDRGHLVGDAHWDQEGDLAPGDELSLDRGMALVQVEDCTGEKQQDLTDLLDKRAREVEKRRQIAAAKTRPAPRSSLAGGGAQPQAAQHRPHLPLSSLVQSPGRIGRAAIPAHSPFEARQHRLHQNQPPTADAQPTVPERPPAARKRRASPSPPSKAGYARNLFGTTLNLSSCPGPELLAARARALRQRALSQAAASSTPQDEEETEEREPVQSSPFSAQDGAEATPSKPAKEQRSTLQPLTRHPIASARAVMREAEEAGNRKGAAVTDDEGAGQQPPKKQRKEARKPERQTATADHTTRDVGSEDEPIILERPSKRKTKDTEPRQPRESRQAEDQPQETRKKKSTTTRRSPSPDLMMIDEPDAVEEPPHPHKAPKERHHKKQERKKKAEERPATVVEPKQKEPRTTLRMRSRQKRGLLMLREPIAPLPAPTAPATGDIDDRIVKTPSPEPSAPPPQRSASPEEVIIPSSAPPDENISEAAPVERIPTPAPPESSSEDDLPQVSTRRAKKRMTYSPPPEPDVSDEAPRKKLQRRKATKRAVYEDEVSEEEEEPQPQKRRAARRSAYSEEPESEQEEEDKDEEEASETQGPRITKLPRKGIRSREIIGYVAQGIETLIPGPFASASFRLGGPPVPSVSSEEPSKPAVVESPRPPAAAPAALVPEPSLPIEEKPAVESSAVPQVPEETATVALEETVTAALEETVAAAIDPAEPVPPKAEAEVLEAAEASLLPSVPRRIVAPEAPPPVVRSNSSNAAVAPATTEPNETKLEALSAPAISLAEIPNAQPPESAETETKPAVLPKPPAAVLLEALPASENTSSVGGEMSQAGRPRIANPASRGKKAARREDAAGLAPQVMVPFEPVQPPVARMIRTRPGGGAGRGQIAAIGPMALGPVAPPPPAGAPVVGKKAASMPGFTSASGGTWSRHAHDLLGRSRPERR